MRLISKTHFHLGRLTASEWTHSVSAVRDTPVGDNSAPAPIPCVPLHITLWSQFCRFFSLCWYPIVNEHCGVVANCEHMTEWVYWVQQQNVNWSGSHTQTSQTLPLPSPELLSTSRCSQAPLELCNVLSDSARVFSAASESTCSYGGAFRTLHDLTIWIVKFWRSRDRCAALRETWCRIFNAVVLRVP